MRWNETRGFGFIKPDDGGDNVFCHCSEIQGGNMLQEGESVVYTLAWDERRRKHRATEVSGRAVQ
jgi:cold shock CspA family protein